MRKLLALFFSLLLASCGTFSGGSSGHYRAPTPAPEAAPNINQNKVIHQYANTGKGIAKQIYSRTTYDYDYRNKMAGNKIGRAPQESPEPYPNKICTGYAIEFFVLFESLV